MTLDRVRPHPSREPHPTVMARGRRRLWAVGATLLVLLGGVGLRGVQLCVNPSPKTLQTAARQRWGDVRLTARRGTIFDRHGRPLATSIATPNIVVDPKRVPPEEVEELAARVAAILDVDAATIAAKMRRNSRYARLASRVHPSVAARIDDLDHPALWSERGSRRYYPEEQLAAQVLGFVDASGKGRAGLERYLDEQLRGGSLLVQQRRDRRGLAVDHLRHREDKEGMDVPTTLGWAIQQMAERALESVIERSDPVAASMVVIEVATGDVLAMANVPTFNPNAVGSNPAPRRNHAVQDAIEPGSVMKPFTVAAAIQEGLVHIRTPIDCEGGTYAIGRVRIHDDHPHRVISVGEVIKYSSNIGSAKLALRMGAATFLRYLQRFGFGRRTGIQLPGERAGLLRSAERIKPIELATTSYGQGMTATVLQVASATAALANGGKKMRPRLVKRVEDIHGVPEYIQTPTVEGQVVNEDVARQLARAMVTVTQRGGTGTRARVPGYQVAGKTGTAHKVVDGRYSATARYASFMGFVPADDPVLAVVVTVDEPRKGSRYGGSVAGPAFAQLAGEALRYLGVPPDPALLAEEDVRTEEEEDPPAPPPPLRLAWDGETWTLPSFTGRSMRDVLRGVQGTGLTVELTGSGSVYRQSPPAGARLAPGETLQIALH